jgi:hypothetical protein
VRLAPKDLVRGAANLRDAACFFLIAKRPGELAPILDLEALLRDARAETSAAEAGAAEQTVRQEASA